MKKQLLYLLTLAFLLSCAGDEFAANKSQNTYSVASALEYENKMCAQYSLIKPEVDILVLWDNTSSAFVMTAANRNAIKKLISKVSNDRFNFRILNMPLLGSAKPLLLKSPNSEDSQVYSINPNVAPYNKLDIIDNQAALNSAIDSIKFPYSDDGGKEAGISLATNTINTYTKVFRKKANTFVIVVSNEDDQECERLYPSGDFACAPRDFTDFINTKISNLTNTTDYLDAMLFRFISVIAPKGSTCSGRNSYRESAYAKISEDSYSKYLLKNGALTFSENRDVYNLCNNSSSFFDEILNTLETIKINHQYRYWPVASSTQNLDINSIRIYRSGALLTNKTHEASPTSGYKLLLNSAGDDLAIFNNRDTRILPTLGEPYTGKMIELFGNDRALAGECLSVYYTEKKKYFGFIYLKAGKPSLDKMSVKMIINGQTHTIPQSEPLTNGTMSAGWQYIDPIQVGALANANPNLGIVDRPSNDSIIGHFIKLNGSYIIKDDQNVTFQVDYIPASNYGN